MRTPNRNKSGRLLRRLSMLVALAVTSGCAHLHYERHEPDGTLVIAEVTEFATDAGLEGFRYQSDKVTVSVDKRTQAQSQALGVAVEAAVNAALKAIAP